MSKFLGYELQKPTFVSPETAWLRHGPFAMWLVEALQPSSIVELGSHYGFSYFCFCEAVQQNQLNAKCYAVDTWQGDEHAGNYGEEVFQTVKGQNENYAAFSTLLRKTFAEALSDIPDGSVDLLHVDGRHFYEDVKEDFESWIPKLSQRAVVLFHDTEVYERNFGVWKYWSELIAKHQGLNFTYQHGLGVLFWGSELPDPIKSLKELSKSEGGASAVNSLFEQAGETLATEDAWRFVVRGAEVGPDDVHNRAFMLADESWSNLDKLGRLPKEALVFSRWFSAASQAQGNLTENYTSDLGMHQAEFKVSLQSAEMSAKKVRALQEELVRVHRRPARAVFASVGYRLLKTLANAPLPLTKGIRVRCVEAVQKLDPKRFRAIE
ncbi:MAG: class I SAM-dependent methyltransferase [Pseudomonadota bacterium]|nr:class I SAM-dependent methyltransferase [Pseudomonadota bacterium]